MIAASILASIVVALKLSSNISAPMHACARRMKLLVEGDLDSPVPQAIGRDETAELTRSTAEMVNGLNIIRYAGFFCERPGLHGRSDAKPGIHRTGQLDSGTGSHDQRYLRKCEKDLCSRRGSRSFRKSGRCAARHQRGICQGSEYRHGKDLSLFSGDLPDHCHY